ncbi:MAG: class I SAM-dependent methyltransferase [Rhodopirellula sp. JB044]|uniref:class I SAM-dependent methyltransferase n=1 Tax=Rhodopirellula sp. JB044 TaxID=3342844 RepID=UPI00370BCEAA
MSYAVTRPNSLSYFRRAGWVLRAWMKNPTQVATVCPSSPYLTQAIADRDCVRHADTIVELGPGAGGTTLGLLERMSANGRLVAIEKTGELAAAAAEIVDPRLHVEHADAQNLCRVLGDLDISTVDVVVSGIPFSALPVPVAKRIMQSVHQSLAPGGRFIAYQFRPDVCEFARPLFGPPTTETVMLNVPPLRIHVWEKVETRDPVVPETVINA